MELEVVSKPQIRSKGKASGRSGKRSIHGYVSIYRRPATQPLGLRWGFETTSKQKTESALTLASLKLRKQVLFNFTL